MPEKIVFFPHKEWIESNLSVWDSPLDPTLLPQASPMVHRQSTVGFGVTQSGALLSSTTDWPRSLGTLCVLSVFLSSSVPLRWWSSVLTLWRLMCSMQTEINKWLLSFPYVRSQKCPKLYAKAPFQPSTVDKWSFLLLFLDQAAHHLS